MCVSALKFRASETSEGASEISKGSKLQKKSSDPHSVRSHLLCITCYETAESAFLLISDDQTAIRAASNHADLN